VRGFLVWDSPAQFLTDAVRQLAVGRKVVDPRLSFREQCPLTTREADALRVAAEGSTTAEIATVLCLSEGTVRNYLSRAIAKTGSRNRMGAIRVAASSGWL
jgi:two-component system, NarL family, response regulator DesR